MKIFLLILLICATGCGALSVESNVDAPYKPPLYWSVYEYHIALEMEYGLEENYIPESEFLANIDWVDEELKDLGYDMIAVDGWGDQSQLNEHGYLASHSRNWEHDFAWWSEHLRSRGMRLGMYGNPLWVHVDPSNFETKIVGTEINVSDLADWSEESEFTWVQVDRPGAEEYVKGHIEYYAGIGIDFFRIDFLSWYENGYDRYLGRVGPDRPREHYETALRWMREAADDHGVYLSLVMPHLFNEAELERRYGHMFRVGEDTGEGGWWKFSEKDRGRRFDEWSMFANPFDGLTYWSYVSGRNQVRLDGDFIRINTFDTVSEKQTVLSANLIAGGPVSVADQYYTIGDDAWVYQNDEMLALNEDGFVGQPQTNDPTDEASQVWTGHMTNGDGIVALFNRESTTATRSISFDELGFSDSVSVRDLWQHADLGTMSSVSVDLPPHRSIVLRLSEGSAVCREQSIAFDEIADRDYEDGPPSLSSRSASGLPVEFEVALGPAEIDGNEIRLTGQSGTVYLLAKQSGDEQWCAAIPQVQSFEVSGRVREDNMYLSGTFTNWNTVPMQLEGEEWVARRVRIPYGDHALKFTNSSDWSGDDWGDADGLTGTVSLTTGGGPNARFSVPKFGFYRASFNDVTGEYELVEMER